jgi:PAS domain S-box-containing protein
VLSVLKDAETGQRGFILTGQERYLEPYNAARLVIQRDFEAAAGLVKNDPDQEKSLLKVRSLAGDKLAELGDTIRMRRQGGAQAALPTIMTGRGEQIMDQIRVVVDRMERLEQERLATQTQQADRSAERAIWTLSLWMPVSLLVLTIVVVVLIRTAGLAAPGEPRGTAGEKWTGLLVRYGCAALAAAVATVLRRQLIESFGPMPTFVTFYPAVILVAVAGGGGPGILATILCALAVQYWYLPPYGSFRIDAPNDVLALGIFTAAGLFLSIFAERLRRSRFVEAFALAQQQHGERLSAQNDELSRQSEELSQQTEELSQQAEELAGRNEELQAQSEEIHSLNEALSRREELLQKLLDATRLTGVEQVAIQNICDAATQMFGEAVAAVAVYEKQADRLVVHATAGVGDGGAAPRWRQAEHTFAELVIHENRTACLNDAALRPDLSMLEVAGQPPFRAVLCSPMLADGRAFGAVGLYSRQKQEWTAEQFRLAEWLAGQCARILETLRMQRELRREAALIDLSPDGIMVRRLEGTITHWGHGAETLYGWSKEEACGQTTHSLLKTQFPEPLAEINRQLLETGRWTGELIHTAKDGRRITVESRWLAGHDERGEIVELLESNVDITERTQADLEREVAVEFLRLVNESTATQDLVAASIGFFQRRSGCEAVGMRLRDGDDFPYFEARGFPPEFLQLENSLCTRDLDGQLVRDSAGDPVIECMCGNVICGRVDPAKPFFTPHGSFWTNNTTQLLASTTEADRQSRTRNRCNGQGYESVALVPLRVGSERLGLLQLNDRRPGMFSAAKMAYWERLAGYLAVALARLRAEEALQNERQLLETVVMRMPAAVSLAEGDELRLRLVNPAYQALAPGKEMAGHTLAEVWPEIGLETPDLFRRVLAGGEPHHALDQLFMLRRSPDGPLEPRYFSWSVFRVRLPGDERWALLNTAWETTEQKAAEDLLRQAAEELRRSNQELEQFAYVSSHDLQEPLRQVRSFVQLLRDRYQEQFDDRGAEYLRFIVDGASRMSELVQDLLAYSRVGAREKRRQPVSCRDALEKALVNLQASMTESQAQVTFDELPTVTADPLQMSQLFQNLVGNALKFCRDDVPPEIHVGARREGAEWLLSVRDNGIGIDPQYTDKIFQIFQRLHARDKYPGTGIGLALCKKIVEQHGGRIWMESQPGQGTTFFVTIPEAAA